MPAWLSGHDRQDRDDNPGTRNRRIGRPGRSNGSGRRVRDVRRGRLGWHREAQRACARRFWAGIAAAFNAPLAGIVFAIEELAKAFTGRINEIIIGSVAIGGAISWLIIGNYPYFGEVSTHLGRSVDWLAVPVCAVFGGVLGGLFSRAMVAIMRKPPRFIAILRRRPVLFAALCGLAVAGLSIETFGYAAGAVTERHALG